MGDQSDKRILIGSDHAGLTLKSELGESITQWGWAVEDVGCFDTASVDYPKYALAVAEGIVAGRAPLGLLVCGSGIGMSITANKVRGIRAAHCHDPYSAAMARAHNDANVLCLGGRVIGPELGKAVVRSFLEGHFEGGRHARRLGLIEAVERDGGGER